MVSCGFNNENLIEMKIQIENLMAQIRGVQLNGYQRALALDEYYKLLDYVEELDDDLTELEDNFYGEYDDDSECCCDDDEDYCSCDDDEDYVEVTCPQCHEVVCFDKDILDSEDLIEVVCPVCDAVVFVNNGQGVPADQTAEPEETND